MKIVHMILNGILTDNFTYQDNLLTKYHKKLGYDVTAITNEYIYNHGELVKDIRSNYINEDGVHVIRLKIQNDKSFNFKFKRYIDIIETLEKEAPDILFIHSSCFIDIKIIKDYLNNHKNVIVYLDNHCDRSNSGTNFLSYNILHKIIWRHYAQLINPYVKKFYGVMPSRVDWLTNVYKLPKEKCKLLVMGADDELVISNCNKDTANKLKEKLGIKEKDFIIVTGGKIDLAKKQTLLLMKSVININRKNIKLVIFGSVVDELKKEFDKLCNVNKNIIYVGWVTNEEAYQYFNIADLVVFPGRHSVYWEIVTAIGKPMICKKWNGTDHVDIGGNVIFLQEDSDVILQNTIEKLLSSPEEYEKMKKCAQKKENRKFLYSQIAKESVE